MASRKLRRSLAPILIPISLLYGILTGIRNRLFDLNILRSVDFDFPVISVGNITVGGTGKTPFVEYLLHLLSIKFNVGVLSRGYKRKTKGFLIAGRNTTPEDIGDESYQILQKFENVIVAVDEKRVRGIELLRQRKKKLDCVILDDAYQHRYVKPGVSILLIDYYRPLTKDRLLPFGDLRENRHRIDRANIVVVTKVPCEIKPIEKRLWIKDLNLFPYQFLYFTTFEYGKLTPVFHGKQKQMELNELSGKSPGIVLLTGIANPEPLYRKLKSISNLIQHVKYPDHHSYSRADLDTAQRKFRILNNNMKLVITTEKDAVKIRQIKNIHAELKESIYYLPVKIRFLDDKQQEFNQHIMRYVTKNKRISRLHR